MLLLLVLVSLVRIFMCFLRAQDFVGLVFIFVSLLSKMNYEGLGSSYGQREDKIMEPRADEG